MRRLPVAALVALTLPSVPATARADLLDTYERLADRRLSPAPLVPTTIPRAFAPIERAPEPGTTIRGRGYAVRLVQVGGPGPDAVIELSGGEFRTMRALLRELRRQGYRASRRIGIRGRRGYLLTRRGPLSRMLAWSERGVVYSLGSGTPRTISLRNLKSTTRGLDRLERGYVGGASDPENASSAVAVTTTKTLTAHVEFEAKCPASVRVGQAKVTLVRRQGDAFSFAVDSGPWTGTITGTVSPDAIAMEVHATAAIEGETCDTGTLALVLR